MAKKNITDIASAILAVCNSRRKRGATTLNIIGYLTHLKTNTHSNNAEMVEFIEKAIIMEGK